MFYKYSLLESLKQDDIKDLVTKWNVVIEKLEKLDPNEESGEWKHLKMGTQLIPIKNLFKNDGARIIKMFSKHEGSEVVNAFDNLLTKYQKFIDKLSKSSDKSDGDNSEGDKPKLYSKEEMCVYTTEDGGIQYAILTGPDKKVIGFVGLSDPKKSCNNSTQIKYIAVDDKYQGKGIGGFLYKLGGIIAEEYLDKSGITSDHTESSTKAAQNVWKGMSKYFDQFENSSGNSEYDYTGKKTPDDKKDDCTKPGEGAAATDYTWAIKDSTRSKTQSELDKMIDNAEKLGEIEDLDDQMMKLWNNVYSSSRSKGGLAESILKRWNLLAGTIK